MYTKGNYTSIICIIHHLRCLGPAHSVQLVLRAKSQDASGPAWHAAPEFANPTRMVAAPIWDWNVYKTELRGEAMQAYADCTVRLRGAWFQELLRWGYLHGGYPKATQGYAGHTFCLPGRGAVQKKCSSWGGSKMVPQNHGFQYYSLAVLDLDDLGYPYFRKPPCYYFMGYSGPTYVHIYIYTYTYNPAVGSSPGSFMITPGPPSHLKWSISRTLILSQATFLTEPRQKRSVASQGACDVPFGAASPKEGSRKQSREGCTICMFVSMYTDICMHVYIQIYWIYIYVYMYMYICIYVYVYMYM